MPEKREKVLPSFLVLKVLNRSLFGFIIPTFGEWEVLWRVFLHILLKQELERLAYDIGSVCVDELGVLVEFMPDLFLQAGPAGL